MHNHIVIDHHSHTAIDKNCGFDLLNDPKTAIDVMGRSASSDVSSNNALSTLYIPPHHR